VHHYLRVNSIERVIACIIDLRVTSIEWVIVCIIDLRVTELNGLLSVCQDTTLQCSSHAQLDGYATRTAGANTLYHGQVRMVYLGWCT